MISSLLAASVKKFRQAERDPGPFPRALTGWFAVGGVNGPFFLQTRLTIEDHFLPPTASMRRELFALHLPNPERVKANLRNLALQSRGLSGGDILNICLNAIHADSRDPDPARWMVTEEMLVREIRRARAAKARHTGKDGSARRIGFQG